jgi:hypothetical protein
LIVCRHFFHFLLFQSWSFSTFTWHFFSFFLSLSLSCHQSNPSQVFCYIYGNQHK